jgi:hypothetical protein
MEEVLAVCTAILVILSNLRNLSLKKLVYVYFVDPRLAKFDGKKDQKSHNIFHKDAAFFLFLQNGWS